MKQRLRLLTSLIIIGGGLLAQPTRAATPALAYGGLTDCYQLGSAIPDFTLQASVAEAGSYRMTHAVAIGGGPAGPPATVFAGPLAAGAAQTDTIDGGTATVPGTYALSGRLSRVISGTETLVAEASATIMVADPCPEPPQPTTVPPQPSDSEQTAPADVQWSLQAEPTRGAATGALLSVTAHGWNAGAGGESSAIVSYDPAALRLLDALAARPADWVRERDDAAGRVRIALGYLDAAAGSSLTLRFLVLGRDTDTVIRLARDDAMDRANPLFLYLGKRLDGPLPLTGSPAGGALAIQGRGYKPGERLAVWANTRQGAAKAIDGAFAAESSADGTIRVEVAGVGGDVESIVVQGQSSKAIGVAAIAPASSKAAERHRVPGLNKSRRDAAPKAKQRLRQR